MLGADPDGKILDLRVVAVLALVVTVALLFWRLWRQGQARK